MNHERLQSLLSQFPQRRIAVLGDFFLDKYLEVDPQLAEPSLETGRTAHQVIQRRHSPGAAGTVVNNLAALGAGRLHAIGAIGDDGEGYDLCQGLQALGCSTDGLLRRQELMTPTYLKPRDAGVAGLAGEHSRYDTKNRRPTPADIVNALAAKIEAALTQGEIDAFVIMDQVELPDCGVVTARLRDILSDHAAKHRDILFWADSRRFIRQYRNVMIKPNQFEAIGKINPAPGDEVSQTELHGVITRLRAESGVPVFLTWGEKGIFVSDPEIRLVPGLSVSGPIDPTGAGDSATAGAVLALTSGATPAEAALVANLVASVTVRQLGTTGTAKPAELREALTQWQAQHPHASI